MRPSSGGTQPPSWASGSRAARRAAVRLFVVVELSDDWRQAALEIRAELESRLTIEARGALRWVPPELMHLTLRFLGEFAEEGLERLEAALRSEVGVIDIGLSSGRVGWFGARRRPATLWLGVDGDVAALGALARRIDRACVGAGALPESRALAPHVTVARVRERASPDVRRQIAGAVDGLTSRARVEMQVGHVALVRSHLGAGSPRYEVLSRHPAVQSEE